MEIRRKERKCKMCILDEVYKIIINSVRNKKVGFLLWGIVLFFVKKKIIDVFSRVKVGKYNIDNRNFNTFRRKCEFRKVGKM